jgi:PhzF family phenazine biosynthesis protein
MKALPFHIVDVFAAEPLTGNPLFVVEAGADVAVDVFRRIAREFNQSETTFLLPPTRPEADWRLRSFSAAGVEVFGAGGHNTLGAWWVLADTGRLPFEGSKAVFRQEIGDRVLPVTISRAAGRIADVTMEQEAPVKGNQLRDVMKLANALGLTARDIATDRAPCQVISTGAAHLMVPIRDREAVDGIRPDAAALLGLLGGVAGEGCYVFSLDPRRDKCIAYTRFFNPTVGIAEDPATGTAAGPLAYHLVTNGLAKSGRMTIEQGTAIGRTSLIEVEVIDDTVKVIGRGVIVGSGQLML